MSGNGAGRGARTIDSGIVSIISDDPTNDVVNPITGPMRAIDVKEVLFDGWLMARTKIQVRMGVELSNNPVDFVTGVVRKELTPYLTLQGWTYGSVWYDTSSLGFALDADYKLYLRFVALAKTTLSSTKAEGAQLRVVVQSKPLRSRTVASPMVRVNTKGSTTVPAYSPVTDPLPAADVALHRVTAEVMANTGCSLIIGWQQTDTPDDVSSWVNGATPLSTAITGNTMFYPGKAIAVNPTKRYIRYATQGLNVSGTEIESALVRMTIDQRDR